MFKTSEILYISVCVGGGFIIGQKLDLKTYVGKLRIKYPNALIPPDLVFPLVWTLLYILYGLTMSWIIENRHEMIFTIIAGLVLNFLWTPMFFFDRKLSLLVIALQIYCALLVLNDPLIEERIRIYQGIYLAWLSFAALLNFQTI